MKRETASMGVDVEEKGTTCKSDEEPPRPKSGAPHAADENDDNPFSTSEWNNVVKQRKTAHIRLFLRKARGGRSHYSKDTVIF